MNLAEINFPVFKLADRRPEEQGGVLFYETETYNNNTDTYSSKIKVIDDRNLAFPTLSHRRLKLKAAGEVELFNINVAVYFLGDLIKLARPNTWWIDYTGKIFEYKKSQRAKLRFYRLEKCFTTEGMGAIVQVKGLAQRFKTMFIPKADEQWCGILECENGIKIFYGYYTRLHTDTWRMI